MITFDVNGAIIRFDDTKNKAGKEEWYMKSVLKLQKLKTVSGFNGGIENSMLSIFCLIKSSLSITNCLNEPENPGEGQ